MENKVVFGLEKTYYAVVNEVDGVISYDTPYPFPGAVSLAAEPKGETAEFFADNIIYYADTTNQGYETELEVANIPEHFRINVLGEIEDVYDGVIVETADAKTKKIALLFQFEGDVKATRHGLVYCTVSRPGVSSSTKTTSTEPTTTTLSVVASPRPTDKQTKISTGSKTSEEAYNAWYSRVWSPTGA